MEERKQGSIRIGGIKGHSDLKSRSNEKMKKYQIEFLCTINSTAISYNI